jgi:hypothetical protein
MTASTALHGPTIVYMRPWNITDRKAARRTGRVMSCTKRESIAGITGTAGGTSTSTSGEPSTIGTIAIMIAMTGGNQVYGAASMAAPAVAVHLLLLFLAHLHGEIALVTQLLD